MNPTWQRCSHRYPREDGANLLCQKHGEMCKVTGPGGEFRTRLCAECQVRVSGLGWKVEQICGDTNKQPASSTPPAATSGEKGTAGTVKE